MISEWKHGAQARQRAAALATPAAPPAEAFAARFQVDCDGDAAAVLGRVEAVLGAVLAVEAPWWPDADGWRARLPEAFVARCAPAPTPAEARALLARWWQGTPAARRREAATEAWSLEDWLFWMHPDERPWGLWAAAVAGPDRLLVTALTDGWPTPWGALWWLFVGSGARAVTPVDRAAA